MPLAGLGRIVVFTTRLELPTVHLALAEFQEQFTNDWSLLMAAVVIATLSVVMLFLIGQRPFIRCLATQVSKPEDPL